MKATEVFIEQLIIGVGAVIIGVLPFAPELLRWWSANKDPLSLEPLVALGVLVVGGCYLLGILLDRFIDTLLQRLDGHHRLRLALGRPEGLENLGAGKDPFPEDDYDLAALLKRGEVASWRNYLRSRIRLTRFLAVYLPGLTVSAVCATAPAPPRPSALFAWLGGVYLAAFLLQVTLGKVLRPAPRTDENLTEYAERRGYEAGRSTGGAGGLVWAIRRKRGWNLAADLATDVAIVGAALLLISAFVLTYRYRAYGASTPWALPILGTLLAALAGWTWWRILATYRKFLRKIGPPPHG